MNQPHEHPHAGDHDHDLADHAADGHVHPHPAEDHSHVGEGYVALDIGEGYGAVILWMPESMLGEEIEVHCVGDTEPPPHVMVLGRPVNGQKVATCVYPSLIAGEYEFWVKPGGPVQVTVTVEDGAVAEATWPAS